MRCPFALVMPPIVGDLPVRATRSRCREVPSGRRPDLPSKRASPDVDVLRRDRHRVVLAAFEVELLRVVELVVHRYGFASCRGFLDIRGQREHLEFVVPGAVRAADSSVLRNGAVREGDVEPFVWLVCPCVAHTEQLADCPLVRLVTGGSSGESADRRREPERVGRAGVNSDGAAANPHLDGVGGRISAETCGRRLLNQLRIASELGAAVPQLHGLTAVVETAEQTAAEDARLAGASRGKSKTRPKVDVLESVIVPRELAAAVELRINSGLGVFVRPPDFP